jgi:exonuclease SbcC
VTPWLKTLVIEDFRSIRGSVSVSLDAPVVLIHGPNGTGKTTLLSAIELGLTSTVGALERFDPAYVEHLPHKDAENGEGRVMLTAAYAEGTPETKFIANGTLIEGEGLLTPEDARFFVERCYLAQATLGRLLEIYEHQDTRKTDSPLTRFVKELLGLAPLDALVEGLRATGNVQRFREVAPLFWAARKDLPTFDQDVARAREQEGQDRAEVVANEMAFRELAGDLVPGDTTIDPEVLDPRLRALAEEHRLRLAKMVLLRRNLAGAAEQVRLAEAADVSGERRAAEDAAATARGALDAWTDEAGTKLETLITAIQASFPDVPPSATDIAAAHRAATAAVKAERERLQQLVTADESDGRVLAEVQASVTQGLARIAAIDTELTDSKEADEELAAALTAITTHIAGEDCPVCGRDFSEISDKPLAMHVSTEVARLVGAVGRLRTLVGDRSTTSAAVIRAQRQESEISARRLSQVRRDELKVILARLAEWSNDVEVLAPAAEAGGALHKAAAAAQQRLAELNSQDSAVGGLRAQLAQYADDLVRPAPGSDTSLSTVVSDLLKEAAAQEAREAERVTARTRAQEILETIAATRRQLTLSEGTHAAAVALRDLTAARKTEADARIEIGKDLAAKARTLRTEKVRQVFNDELNAIWRELFIRLAPDEAFVPAFALPQAAGGAVEAILETHYRSGGKGGNPRSMLSAGNLNTAALTLFLALNLSVKPVLPWLIIDDPVQSMDDVHIAQFAALLRTLKQTKRQLIIAVHDRQLFEYLALELSPAFNGDRLITIELGRGADGRTTAPWDLKTYEPDRAIEAQAA